MLLLLRLWVKNENTLLSCRSRLYHEYCTFVVLQVMSIAHLLSCRSRLYHEYCLCVLLFPQPKSCTWVPSSRQLSSLLRSVTTSNGFIVRHRSSHLELVGVASETGSVTSGRMSVMSLGLPDEIWEEEPVAIVTDNTCTRMYPLLHVRMTDHVIIM